MASIDIGKRVNQVREAVGLNQRDFASKLGSSSGRISEIESGKNMPGGDFLLRLHQEFKVDLTWLLTGTTAGGVVPQSTLASDEAALLDNYRNSPKEAREALKATSAAFAKRSSVSHKKSA